MKFRTASLVELHAFLGVCRTGSMRRAAEQLCVTQAAVSRAVSRLEERLGYPLFERGAQGVAPTAQAHALRLRIEPSVDELERTFADVGRTHARRHVLRLSVVPTLGTRWLMPRLRQFQAGHPDVRIELRQFHHDEDFRRDDVDAWIAIRRPGKRWPRAISARYLLGREITPICAPAIAGRLKAPRSLLKEALLHHTNYPDNWSLWLGAAGVPVDRLVLGNGYDLGNNLIVAAVAGMGIVVVQPCLVERELASGELAQPFPMAVATDRGYYLCTRKLERGDGVVDLFADWVIGAARSETAGPPGLPAGTRWVPR